MNRRISATRVGVVASANPATRCCTRCGRSNQINSRTQPTSPYVCRGCRQADPEYVRLIGA